MFDLKLALVLLLMLPAVAWGQDDTTASRLNEAAAATGRAAVNARPTGNDNAFPHNLFPRSSYSPWCVGLFGGSTMNHLDIDVTYATDMKYTDMSGMTFGVGVSRYLKGWLSLHADLAFVQKNNRMDRDNRYIPDVYTESTNNYLSLPVTAVASVGRTFRVVGFFGGYVGYWLSGHREGVSMSIASLAGTGDGSDDLFDEPYEFSSTRDNRFDAGLTYGLGVRCALWRKVDLNAEVRWYYGLTDMQKSYDRLLNPRYNTTRAIQFGVAYWL